MEKFLMIADDFTGAGDAGVQMSKNGIEARIAFNTDGSIPMNPMSLTQSRGIFRQKRRMRRSKRFIRIWRHTTMTTITKKSILRSVEILGQS